MGMYAESAQFLTMVQDETRLCFQNLQQALDSQNPEVPWRLKRDLTCQSQVTSGEGSVDGSMTMETTPPRTLAGVSPASLKVHFCRIFGPAANFYSGSLVVQDLKVPGSPQDRRRHLFNDNLLR